MAAESIRFITATEQVIKGTEDVIVFNSAGAINFNLGPAYGDGRAFKLKNVGAGAVTLVPYGTETIFSTSEESSKILYTGESAGIIDYLAEKWMFESFEFEITPLSEGGTGIEVSGVNRIFYVDGSRTDTYTADGSILRPFKTIVAALVVINADALARQTALTYDQANYTLDVAPGVYSGNLAIGNVKNLRFNLHGVTISGNITYTTTMVGGTADYYYSRLEFAGAVGNRPEKGTAGRITGTFTATRNNDSLSYVSFAGIDIAGNVAFNTNGTWVVQMHSCMLSARFSCGDAAIALLETTGHTIITGAIAAAADGTSVTAVSLYNCDNTEFALINVSNPAGSRVTNCTFKAATATTFTAGTLALDANSYKTLLAATETLVGCTLCHLDNTGLNVTPAVRTNNPTLAANTINANITALDAAIGTDAQLTAVARTTGPVAAANSVQQNIDALDSAIGFEGQMSGTPHVVTFPTTIFQALGKLDTYKSVQTVKKTIGGVGVAGCDFNFATAENQDEQSIDLGAIIPAHAKIFHALTITNTTFTGAVTLAADTGITSGGAELIASGGILTAGDFTEPATGALSPIAIVGTAGHVFLNATPGANWSAVTAGKVSVYITFINFTNI